MPFSYLDGHLQTLILIPSLYCPTNPNKTGPISNKVQVIGYGPQPTPLNVFQATTSNMVARIKFTCK